MSRGRRPRPRALFSPEEAAKLKKCTDCKHCESGYLCTRNRVVTPGKVMIDIVDASEHSYSAEITGDLGCSAERMNNELGRDWRGIMRMDNERCGPKARFFEQKPEVKINVEEFMKA